MENLKVFIIPNEQKSKAFEVAYLAADLLHKGGANIIIEENFEKTYHFPSYVLFLKTAQAYKECDIVLTIGGDGTMLHAAREIVTLQKPMLGINVGRLGFLTIVEKDELENLSRLLTGDYIVENRSLLQVECAGKYPLKTFALNDIVIFKENAENTITLDIYCDEIKVSGFRGDGVVFCTPTGSTAYSMSAGGPIVDASLDAIIVTQICAHIVRMPPMVLSGERILRAVPSSEFEEKIYISCDGLPSTLLDWGEPIYIKQSHQRLPLIQFEDARQLKSIDKKLKGM